MIRKHPLFRELSDEEFEKFIKIFEERRIDKDVFLSKENEKDGKAFILIFGEVSIYKDTIYEDDYIVTEIKANGKEFFGEVSLIDNKEKISTIKTVKESIILEIDRKDMFKFFEKNHLIGYKIMKFLAEKSAFHLRKADKDMVTLFNALVEVVEND